MDPNPEYRAALCRLALTRVRALSDADQVLERVPHESIEIIDSATGLAWIVARPLDELNAALLRQHGREGYLDFWADLSTIASSSPLIAALAEAAMRIFGHDNPRGPLKWMGRAWELTCRNFGTVVTQDRGDHVRIEQRSMPPSHRTEPFVLSMHGSILGIVRNTGNRPQVDVDLRRFETEGVATYVVRW